MTGTSDDQQDKEATMNTTLQNLEKMLAALIEKQTEQEKLNQKFSEQMNTLISESIAMKAQKEALTIAKNPRHISFSTPISKSAPAASNQPPPPPARDPATGTSEAATTQLDLMDFEVVPDSFDGIEEIEVEDPNDNPTARATIKKTLTRANDVATQDFEGDSGDRHDRTRNRQRVSVREIQDDTLEELRATLRKQENEMKVVKSQMHRATSKAPELDRIPEESSQTHA